MTRVINLLSLSLMSIALVACMDSGSGTPQHNPYKDHPNYIHPFNPPEYSDDAADQNAEITGLYSRTQSQVENWIGSRLQLFNPDGFQKIPDTEYTDVASWAVSLITADDEQIAAYYSDDANMLRAAMAVLDRAMAVNCFKSTGADTGACIAQWRTDNEQTFNTAQNNLLEHVPGLTADDATLTAANGYVMQFVVDDASGAITGMRVRRGDNDTIVLTNKYSGNIFLDGGDIELTYESYGRDMGLGYADFGLINIIPQGPDEFLIPFAGGYADKAIAVTSIDTDMEFSGRATGRVARGNNIIELTQDASRPTTLKFDSQSKISKLNANFNNWYDVVVDSNGAISFSDYKDNHPGGTPIDMRLAATPDDGTITADRATMNVGYYGPSTTPTQATGLVHYQETGVENPVSLDMAFGVK